MPDRWLRPPTIGLTPNEPDDAVRRRQRYHRSDAPALSDAEPYLFFHLPFSAGAKPPVTHVWRKPLALAER